MDKDKEFLGTEKIGKLLFRLAVPTVIAQIVNMLYNIVDRIYIGHIPGEGSAALTGVGVCMPIIMIISAFAALVSAGGAPRASISLGKGDKDGAEKILGSCFLLQLILSVMLTAVLLIWNRKLLLMFGASENTIDYAAAYMDIYAVGTIFVQLTLGLNAFITNGSGLCKNRYAHRYNRRGGKYSARPAVYICFRYGSARSSCCHGNFSGRIVRLGGVLFAV